jgi:tetratricopeptide (TPR) repeat protein
MNAQKAFDRGMEYGRKGKFRKAAVEFQKAIELAPAEPYPPYELGYSLMLLGDVTGALQAFERAEELRPGFFLVQTYIHVCRTLLSGALPPEGLALFQRLQWIADAGIDALRETATRELAETLIRIAPESPLGHYFLGKAVFECDPAKAEAELTACLERNPDATTAIDALQHLGSLRAAAGDHEGARCRWQEAIDTYPGNFHTKFCELNLAAPEAS